MEGGGFVIAMFSVALAIVVWYSAIRYKRQFPIAMWMTAILFILALAEVIITSNWVPIIAVALSVVIFVSLIWEKQSREKRGRIDRANAEANEVE